MRQSRTGGALLLGATATWLGMAAVPPQASASSLTLFARSTLRDPSGAVQENRTDRTGPTPFFPAPLQSEALTSSNGSELRHRGLADFGLLQARAAWSYDGADADPPDADATVRVTFEDMITITGGSGDGTFNALFSLEGVLDALVDAGASAVLAESGYSFRLTVADGVFEWSGGVAENRPGSRSETSAASLTVGGVPVSPPAANPPGAYTTPVLHFSYGVPFVISGELEVHVVGDADDGLPAGASAVLNGGFQWLGMENLDAGAGLQSMSGFDYREGFANAPEPEAAMLLAPVLIVLLWRARSAGLAGRPPPGPASASTTKRRSCPVPD